MSCPGSRAHPPKPPRLITLHERLFDSAAARPHAIALITREGAWNYERLARYVRRLAQSVAAQGLKPGDLVALHFTNRPEAVAALYACMLAGVIAVPLNTWLKHAELEAKLLRLRVSLYLGQADLYDAVASIDPSILEMDKRFVLGGLPQDTGARAWSELIEHGGNDTLPPPRVDVPMILLSTSGTTGDSKFVVHTARTAFEIVSALQAIALRPDDVALIAPSIMHATGLFATLTTLAAAATCVLMDRFEPREALDLIELHRCTMLWGLPVMYSGLIARQRAQPRKVTSLQTCLVSGDTTESGLHEQFLGLFGVRMRNILAMSESAGTFTYGFDSGPVSRAVDMDRVCLVDGEGTVVTRGEAGELMLRGPNLFAGYWVSPGCIDDARKEGWWASGDVLRQDEAGDFWYVGRRCQSDRPTSARRNASLSAAGGSSSTKRW
jgi:long-chain acyl-CoA synthetase